MNTPNRTAVVTKISETKAKAYPNVKETWKVPIYNIVNEWNGRMKPVRCEYDGMCTIKYLTYRWIDIIVPSIECTQEQYNGSNGRSNPDNSQIL